MTLPKIDIRTSNYTVCAVSNIESAKEQIDLAYVCHAKGRTEMSVAMIESAIESYEIAAKNLLAHAVYVRRLLKECNE